MQLQRGDRAAIRNYICFCPLAIWPKPVKTPQKGELQQRASKKPEWGHRPSQPHWSSSHAPRPGGICNPLAQLGKHCWDPVGCVGNAEGSFLQGAAAGRHSCTTAAPMSLTMRGSSPDPLGQWDHWDGLQAAGLIDRQRAPKCHRAVSFWPSICAYTQQATPEGSWCFPQLPCERALS